MLRINERASRRAGELLKQIEPQQGGDRKSEEYQRVVALPLMTRKEAASDAGMSPHQAKQAVRIEVTPEMVQPGALALSQHGVLVSPNMDMEQGRELAEEVFRSMIARSPHKLGSPT